MVASPQAMNGASVISIQHYNHARPYSRSRYHINHPWGDKCLFDLCFNKSICELAPCNSRNGRSMKIWPNMLNAKDARKYLGDMHLSARNVLDTLYIFCRLSPMWERLAISSFPYHQPSPYTIKKRLIMAHNKRA